MHISVCVHGRLTGQLQVSWILLSIIRQNALAPLAMKMNACLLWKHQFDKTINLKAYFFLSFNNIFFSSLK